MCDILTIAVEQNMSSRAIAPKRRSHVIHKVGIYHEPQRNKPWLVRWFGEYDAETGRQRRYCKSFKRKADAEKFRAAKTHEFMQGIERDKKPDARFGAFCEDWLTSRKTELQPASYDLYAMTVKRMNEYFGEEALLKDITPRNAALFLAAQKNRSKESEGMDLSEWSREQIKRHGKTIFQTAVDWGNIQKNPFRTLRRKKLALKRWHRITTKEFFALLDVAPTLRWQAFYALAYTSGARFGELFSLTWTDIDFETGAWFKNGGFWVTVGAVRVATVGRWEASD